MAQKLNKSLTTRDDWIEAGYVELGEVGPEGVSVESIARRLGVSKAGFYHRFKNRKELLDLVVQRWFDHSEAIIAGVPDDADPIEQIVGAAQRAITDTRLRRADTWLLLRTPSDADHAEYSRMTRTSMIGWVQHLLLGLGLPPEKAHARASLIYFGYVGLTADLEAMEPEPDEETIHWYLDQMVRSLARS